jgi:hypothetical protein
MARRLFSVYKDMANLRLGITCRKEENAQWHWW